MNGIEKIIARLEADAQAEIDALNAESREEIDALMAEYQSKADTAYLNAVRDGKAACALRAERMASSAELESRKELLSFKQELVSEVFSRAAERLAKLPKEEYVAFLAAQAAKAASTGQEELVFNAADSAELGSAVAKAANKLLKTGHLTVSPETRDIPGGVIVKQGDIETNCAIDTLIHLRRNDLASQVAEILFAT